MAEDMKTESLTQTNKPPTTTSPRCRIWDMMCKVVEVLANM